MEEKTIDQVMVELGLEESFIIPKMAEYFDHQNIRERWSRDPGLNLIWGICDFSRFC